MKRISIEDTQVYIELNKNPIEGVKLDKAYYYSISPSDDPFRANEGWEKITYYSYKRKNRFSHKGEGNNWVYILSNPLYPDLLKIGYTKLSPDERAKQISSSTGVALPFKLEWALKCFNGEGLESEIHTHLQEYRINSNREFFNIGLEEAKKIIILLGEKYI
jgi:hypothetical protein